MVHLPATIADDRRRAIEGVEPDSVGRAEIKKGLLKGSRCQAVSGTVEEEPLAKGNRYAVWGSARSDNFSRQY